MMCAIPQQLWILIKAMNSSPHRSALLFLPLGSLVYLLFCVTRYGWGWQNYKKEVNTGKGLKVQDWMRGYLTYVLPLIVVFIFAFGLYDKFLA